MKAKRQELITGSELGLWVRLSTTAGHIHHHHLLLLLNPNADIYRPTRVETGSTLALQQGHVVRTQAIRKLGAARQIPRETAQSL